MLHWLNKSFLLCWAVATLLFSSAALAGGKGPVVVADFAGAKSEGIRKQVVSVLTEAGYDVVADDETPAVDASSSAGQFAELAGAGGYRAFVMAYTSMNKKAWSTSFTLRAGETGAVVGKRMIKSSHYKGLLKAITEHFLERLGEPLDKAVGSGSGEPAVEKVIDIDQVEPEQAASVEAEPKEHPPADTSEGAAAEISTDDFELPQRRRRKKGKYSALEIEAGPMFTYRNWALSDSLIGGYDGRIAPTHDVPLMGARLAATIYPAGFASKGWARHLGLQGNVSQSFVGGTEVPDDVVKTPRPTQFLQWMLGVRGRIPAGPVVLGLFGGMGRQALTVDGEKIRAPQPDLKYRFLRGGFDVVFPFNDRLQFDASAEFRMVGAFGEGRGQLQHEDWFPNTEGKGSAGAVGASYGIAKGFKVRLGLTAAYYGLSFNPDVGALAARATAGRPAPPIAGGAVDRYLGGNLSIVYALLR